MSDSCVHTSAAQQSALHNIARLRRIGIDTSHELVVFMPQSCLVCRSEGFEAQTQVRVRLNGRSIIARLNVITSDILADGEAGLSESAWSALGAANGDLGRFEHPDPLESLELVRGKLYGKPFDRKALKTIFDDVLAGRYLDVHLASFVLACGPGRLDFEEMVHLTSAMVDAGDRLDWNRQIVADKHCVGGLPGNRTTMIVVPIVAAAGLTIPKTSSRAITSPAGTADVMETLAPVNLDLQAMRRVVEREGGCIAWGGSVSLSPVDDLLIRVERAIDIDSEGTLIASVLSKKKAAGSTHVVIDIPVGPTAKVRTEAAARKLATELAAVGHAIGLSVETMISDGSQPVGNGIGPALEARDVLAVLRGDANAPIDLRERALALAARLLELGGAASAGQGIRRARDILDSGLAWKKFQAICEAQGGMKDPPRAPITCDITSRYTGQVKAIHNRQIARAAKLAGAPEAKAAGVDLHVKTGNRVERGQPLFTIHAETEGELLYARTYVESHPLIVDVGGVP
ncbi:MAG: thymidine phosphorylase family protein [Planctomycetes bacterium]|nr:thymidine phosphorylase family protein [Planctomycetota bacterium]NUQ33873.1 thymidine phosphorylase family protein [Planctomycetaceae bacterium]